MGLLLDLRQRRGVRGPDYSWANSVRLQRAAAAAALTTGTSRVWRRRPRCASSSTARTTVRVWASATASRWRLEYAERYTGEILDPFDLDALVDELPNDSAAALFCVERDRRMPPLLVAARLRDGWPVPAITDLRPG